MRFADLLQRAAAVPLGQRSRAIIGITGPPGAGKTTLAEALTRHIPGAQHLPMDGFHLADAELDRLGRRQRKGAADTFDVAGYVALLRRIHDVGDQIIYAPAFERTIEQPVAGAIAILPETDLVITEGNYLLLQTGGWQDVRALLDEVWWLEAPEEERASRLVHRHQQFGKTHDAAVSWVRHVDGANAQVIDTTRANADLTVSGTLEGIK